MNNYRRVRPTRQRPWCVGRTLRYSAFYLELESDANGQGIK